MGIILNKRARELNFPDLLVQLDIIQPEEVIRLAEPVGKVPVLKGGPVETGRGFVLHSADFFAEASLPIDDGICLTATLDILKAMASGAGPANAMLALGYAGWSPGQLEAEMQANGWLHCPIDAGFIFDPALDAKYDRALARIGVDLGALSGQAGHA